MTKRERSIEREGEPCEVVIEGEWEVQSRLFDGDRPSKGAVRTGSNPLGGKDSRVSGDRRRESVVHTGTPH